jgi:hypothetical protein
MDQRRPKSEKVEDEGRSTVSSSYENWKTRMEGKDEQFHEQIERKGAQ